MLSHVIEYDIKAYEVQTGIRSKIQIRSKIDNSKEAPF